MLVLLLLIASAAYAQTDPGRIYRATTLARDQKWADAEAMLKGVEPPNAPSERIAFYRLRAAVASGLGKQADAAAELRRALALSPSDMELLLLTAKVERAAKQYDQALRHYSELPPSAENWTAIAGIQDARGDRAAALKAYEEAARMKPDEERYRMNLALAHLRDGAFESIAATLAGMASPRARVLFSLASFALGKEADATKALLEANDLEPDWDAPLAVLGEFELQQTARPDDNAVDRVCSWADRKKLERGGALCGALVLRLAREDNSKDAAEDIVDRLASAAKSSPSDAAAQCGLAAAFEWLGRWQDARAPAEACSGLRPDSVDGFARLARVYEHLGLQDLASMAADRRKQAEEKRPSAEAERRATVQRLIGELIQ